MKCYMIPIYRRYTNNSGEYTYKLVWLKTNKAIMESIKNSTFVESVVTLESESEDSSKDG